ncbi:hypothetical protein QYF61_008764 [Mycteria americana]|uniref:Uncharacterized protein n=1 Tax=Mycteria americana TaxID=33587 RepID=A0AAN7MQ24_MYCAM|nr:hypothetical protein QYF61_008764 [Mycteria americana]
MVRQVVPLQPMEVYGGADIHPAARGGPHAGAGGYALKEAAARGEPTQEQAPSRNCGPVERSPRRSRFSGRTCDPMGDPRWSSLLLKDCTPWKGPMLEQFLKNCSPWEGPTLEKVVAWEPGMHVSLREPNKIKAEANKGDIVAGVCYRQGEEANKAFFKQLEELYRSQIKGNKSFYYHFNSKRLNKETVGLLLNGMGDLVTADIDEAEVLDAFLASICTNSLPGLCA